LRDGKSVASIQRTDIFPGVTYFANRKAIIRHLKEREEVALTMSKFVKKSSLLA
jgi:hypothetical protein